MKKVLTAAVAATLAVGSMGLATTAAAQSRGPNVQNRYEQRHERQDRREIRQDQRQYARWQQAQRRYNAGRYVAPRGHAVRVWSYGQAMPVYYRSSRYVISDYGRYGLRAPPRGYQYVRSGDDVVLAAVAGGLITAVIAGLFN